MTQLVTPALVTIDHLSIEYHLEREEPNRVLKDVAFHIDPGEVVGLLGESGSGKTSLGRAILRLLPDNARIRSGSIIFRGRNLLRLKEAELQKIRGAEIAWIPQEAGTALNPVMRVGEQIAEVLRAHRRWDRKRCRSHAEALMSDVSLPDADQIYTAYPHELSGGQQQRIVIAQALACRPALIIADEPTTALDTITQAEILGLLKSIKKRFGMAMLAITHNPATLTGLADRLLLLRAGTLIE